MSECRPTPGWPRNVSRPRTDLLESDVSRELAGALEIGAPVSPIAMV
ncbi:hypothetical protein [Mycobacterium sp. SA01]